MLCCFIISALMLIWVVAVYCWDGIKKTFQRKPSGCSICSKGIKGPHASEGFTPGHNTRIYQTPFAFLPNGVDVMSGVPSTAIIPDMTYSYWDGASWESCDLCPNCAVCPTCPQCK